MERIKFLQYNKHEVNQCKYHRLDCELVLKKLFLKKGFNKKKTKVYVLFHQKTG